MKKEFVEQSQTFLTALMITMIFIGIILAIIVWKKRNLAPLMLYYELAMIAIMGFIPYN